MLDTNEIFVGAQGFAPSVKLEIISIALFMKWYDNCATAIVLQYGCKSTTHHQGSKVVNVYFHTGLRQIRRSDQALIEPNSGVVDQQGHVWTFCGCLIDRLFIGNIESNGNDDIGMVCY